MEHPDWYAGVDWASETHQVTLVDKTTGERAFAHSGAGLAALWEWLLAIGGTGSLNMLLILVVKETDVPSTHSGEAWPKRPGFLRSTERSRHKRPKMGAERFFSAMGLRVAVVSLQGPVPRTKFAAPSPSPVHPASIRSSNGHHPSP